MADCIKFAGRRAISSSDGVLSHLKLFRFRRQNSILGSKTYLSGHLKSSAFCFFPPVQR